jgi:hypothetical protein
VTVKIEAAYRYLRFFDLSERGSSRNTGISSDGTVSTSPTSSSGIETPGGLDSDSVAGDERLHIANGEEDGLGISYVEPTEETPHELHHSTSSQTIKTEVTLPAAAPTPVPTPPSAKLSRRASALSEASRRPSLGPPRFRPLFASSFVTQNGSLDLSDSDDSDVDDDVPPANAIRRLPNARNLRQAQGMRGLQSAFRKSVETISSIGTTRTPSVWQNNPFRRSRSRSKSSASEVSDDGSFAPSPAPGVATIPNFVVDGLESDDEEPGDVEAALRRLEGHIDEFKQRERAKKVEVQLGKSADLAARRRGGFMAPAEADSEAESDEEDDADTRSVASTVASDLPEGEASQDSIAPATSPDTSADVLPLSSPSSTAAAPPALLPPPAQFDGAPFSDLQQLGVLPSVARPTSSAISRKPSIRRFFTLPSSRPGSTAGPGAAPRLQVPTALASQHHCFLLHFKTEQVAQQFCLIERDLLNNVTWHECVVSLLVS